MEDVDIFKIEEAALNAWSAPLQMLYDGWVLRFTGGHSKRVNSVNPLYASRLPLDEKIKTCELVYARLGLPCLFRVTDHVADLQLTGALTASGYMAFDPTLVLGRWLEKGREPDADVTILEMSLEDWFQMRAHFISVSDADLQAHRTIVQCIVPEMRLLGLFANGQPLACGMGVVEGALLGFFSIYTDKGWRRKGCAGMIMSALTDWGLEHGATYGYLQVEGDNGPALGFYQKLGFARCYDYIYYRNQVSEGQSKDGFHKIPEGVFTKKV